MQKSDKSKTGAKIRFKAALLRPASPKAASWTFVLLPANASRKLPARGMVNVDGVLDGQSFQTTLQPDGIGGHWLKVAKTVREGAGVVAGDTVAIELTPIAKEPEPHVPADLRKTLKESPQVRTQWSSLTPRARRDWIQWITSAKQAATRERRVANTVDMLASGKRRACCFDRSGIYSKALSAPEAMRSSNRKDAADHTQ